MKNLKAIILCSALLLMFSSVSAQDSTGTAKAKTSAEAQKKDAKSAARPDVANTGTPKEATPENSKSPHDDADNMRILVIIIAFFLIMGLLFIKFFSHLRRNHQRIGFQSIKLIGLILMFPGICILAIAGNGILNSQTLGVLLGTIAGYVLSREDDSKDTKALDEMKKKLSEANAALKANNLPTIP